MCSLHIYSHEQEGAFFANICMITLMGAVHVGVATLYLSQFTSAPTRMSPHLKRAKVLSLFETSCTPASLKLLAP